MGAKKTFTGVTDAIWDCVKRTSHQEHGTVYAPAGAASGTATTSTVVGEVRLKFDFDAARNSVTYEILGKPFIVSEGQIWGGVQGSITKCSS